VTREQGVKLELERNADYWDKASPGNVQKLKVVPIKEDATRVAALLSGDVDMIAPVAPNDQDRVKKAANIQLVTEPSNRTVIFEMNQKTQPAFADKRVRQAVNYAVNQPRYRREDHERLRDSGWPIEPGRLPGPC